MNQKQELMAKSRQGGVVNTFGDIESAKTWLEKEPFRKEVYKIVRITTIEEEVNVEA